MVLSVAPLLQGAVLIVGTFIVLIFLSISGSYGNLQI